MKRFLNVLDFHKALLSAAGELDVDAVDLIAIEAMNSFEPDFFLRIRANKEFLTVRSSVERPKQEDAERLLKTIIGQTQDDAEEARRKAILQQLFPVVERYQSFNSYASHSDSWSSSSRIATAEHFDRYFSFSVTPGDVSNAEIVALLNATDVVQVEATLARWSDQNALEKGLQKLWQRIESIAEGSRRSVSVGVLNLGDRLTSETEGMFQLGSMRTGEGIIFSVLKAEAKVGNPLFFLRDVLNASVGVSLPAHIVALVTNLTQTPELQSFFNENEVKCDLRAWLVQRIEKRSLGEEFLNVGDFKLILRLWQVWGDKEKARARIIELCVDARNAARFVRNMLQVSHSSNVDKYGRSRRARIVPSELDEYGSWSQVQSVLLGKSLPQDIEADFAEALRELRKAAKRKDAGLAEVGSPFDEDDE